MSHPPIAAHAKKYRAPKILHEITGDVYRFMVHCPRNNRGQAFGFTSKEVRQCLIFPSASYTRSLCIYRI